MIAAGVRIFVCGVSPATSAKTLRSQHDSEILITDGPYLEAKEHVGCQTWASAFKAYLTRLK
jgi:hypothetical protein